MLTGSTDSMKLAIDGNDRRRAIQMKYNEEHGIVPKNHHQAVRDMISVVKADKEVEKSDSFADLNFDELTAKQKKQMIANLKEQMQDAGQALGL